jgi:hypothetical protein
MAPSVIPGNLPVVFSLTRYRGSAWWINIIPPLSWQGFALGTPTEINNCMEGSRKDASLFVLALLGSSFLGIQKDMGRRAQGTDMSAHQNSEQ